MSASLEDRARVVLENAWDDERGYSYPNRAVYPHLWLWDSCFHAIAWAAIGDPRCVRELTSVIDGQLEDGFLPHMRYAGPTSTRGPLSGTSSLTQPPVFAHAAVRSIEAGFRVTDDAIRGMEAALRWLFEHRAHGSGLLRIVHPWEAGTDDTPRFDDWVGESEWSRPFWTQFDLDVMNTVQFSALGAAIANSRFEVAPAAFNTIAAHAATETARLTGKSGWQRLAEELSTAIDAGLWNAETGLWSDLAVAGGGGSVHAPTLDGVLPALVSPDPGRCATALKQLASRFQGPFGLRYVAEDDERYRPDQYWRGSSWMQMNYLTWLAARRWGEDDLAAEIRRCARRGASASAFAEHWNPETGEGLGAIPQTWSAVVAAMRE